MVASLKKCEKGYVVWKSSKKREIISEQPLIWRNLHYFLFHRNYHQTSSNTSDIIKTILWFLDLPVCMLIYPYVCLFAYLPANLHACLSTCLLACLPTCHMQDINILYVGLFSTIPVYIPFVSNNYLFRDTTRYCGVRTVFCIGADWLVREYRVCNWGYT